MKDVSNRMLGQFADNLAQLIQSGAASAPLARCGCPPRAATTREPAPASRPSRPPATTASTRWVCCSAPTLARSAVRPVLFGVTGLLVGYLYGKNRTLERMVRRA